MNEQDEVTTKPKDIHLSRIELFRERFGDGHFYLACHAALPLSFTPDLLYCLWANFQRDINGEHLNISWVAVSDFLLSGLCEEVGDELYEIDSMIRNELLNHLRNEPRFSCQRLHDLADFLIAYLTPQLGSPDLDIQEIAKTQKLLLLADRNPIQAVQEIAATLARLNLSDKTEWIRMAKIVNILEKPLGDFHHLIIYTYAMADYSRGNLLNASVKFNSLNILTRTIQIAGIDLFIPDSIEIDSYSSEFSSIIIFKLSEWPQHTQISRRNPYVQNSTQVCAVAFSPDSNTIVHGSSDINTIMLWDARTGESKELLNGQKGEINSVAFSPDGNTIVSGSSDSYIRLWDVRTGKSKKRLNGHKGGVNSVVFSPDGNTIASGGSDSYIRLWDVRTGKSREILNGYQGAINSVAFSPDGNTIVSGSSDSYIRLWDARTGASKKLLNGHEGEINSVAFNPDGNTIVSGGSDSHISLWNSSTGKLKNFFNGHEGGVNSVAFSPDGTTIVSGGNDIYIKLWDARTGELKKVLNGHEREINSVAFSPDGNTIVSTSKDFTVRLWSVRLDLSRSC
jgi:hypothetical protein